MSGESLEALEHEKALVNRKEDLKPGLESIEMEIVILFEDGYFVAKGVVLKFMLPFSAPFGIICFFPPEVNTWYHSL
jgi:hypothetical protein